MMDALVMGLLWIMILVQLGLFVTFIGAALVYGK